ncbi:hypothetical protein BMS3Bbin04_00474 [bacterium BMS3Bbin04]|nr:hypothetical protein BMS3Bbin04_00474 [bacterium BMS3Bbin04]
MAIIRVEGAGHCVSVCVELSFLVVVRTSLVRERLHVAISTWSGQSSFDPEITTESLKSRSSADIEDSLSTTSISNSFGEVVGTLINHRARNSTACINQEVH